MPKDIQETKLCRICQQFAQVSNNFDDRSDTVECARCGRYRISQDAGEVLATKEYDVKRRARLAAAVRQATERNTHVDILVGLLPLLADSVVLSPDPMAAADEILLYLEPRTAAFGSYVPFDILTFYPLFSLINAESLKAVVEYMVSSNFVLIHAPPRPGLAIQPAGYARIRELRATSRASRRAFVAMSFDLKLRPTYDTGIKPAVMTTGFEPIRVDEVAHNDRIDERIIAEIRRSAFVIADFSDPRSGVFFEAGFGLGLGLPVIWTCSASSFDALPKHFDTRQFNYIKWDSVDELRERLRNRILATVPGAKDSIL